MLNHQLLCVLCLSLTLGCGSSSSPQAPDAQPENSGFQPVPLSSQITHVQPMTGIALWHSNTADLAKLGGTVQLEFAYLLFNQIASQPATYDWSGVEQLLSQIASRGHQAILRFRYVYPGFTDSSVPAYIENLADYHPAIANVESQPTYLPDWRHPALESFTLAFFSEFAQRYNHDPRIAFLQVGFGSYAEYHLYDGPLTLGHTFPSKAFQRQFLEHMQSHFSELRWSISIDAASRQISPIADDPVLKMLDYGLFDDSFMHQQHSQNDQEYNRASWLFFGADKYRHSPAGGEFSYYSNHDQQNALNPQGPYGRSFESFASQYHISYIIGNDQPDYHSPARIKQAAMATGYQFDVTAFERSDSQTSVTIKNSGVAPLYYDAYPSVNAVRAQDSLKGLLPGRQMTFVIPVSADSPILRIESDRLVAGQHIQYRASLSPH